MTASLGLRGPRARQAAGALVGLATGLLLALAATAAGAVGSQGEIASYHPCPLAQSVRPAVDHECRKAIRPTRSALTAPPPTDSDVFRACRVGPVGYSIQLRSGAPCKEGVGVAATGVSLVGTIRLLN